MREQKPISDCGVENLRAAILKRAVKDYVSAQKRVEKLLSQNNPSEDKLMFAESKVSELERWFMSDWGQTLSGNNGQNIINMSRLEE